MAEGINNTGPGNLALTRLHHFLYMGTEGNSYQPGTRHFSVDSVHSIESLIADGKGVDIVKEIIRFSKESLSICPDALCYALAICAHSTDMRTKTAAYAALQDICPTPSELFAFTRFVEEVSNPTTGWGRARRAAASEWYNSKAVLSLAVLVTRIVSRHHWTHKDIMKLAHIKPANNGIAALFKYLTKGIEAAQKEFGGDEDSKEMQDLFSYLKAVHDLKHTTDDQVAARLIEMHGLTFEHVPTSLLKSKEVWISLIPRLPLNVLLHQLPRLNKLGYLKQNSAILKPLLERLRSENTLTDSQLGPLETYVITNQCETSTKGVSLAPVKQSRQRRPQLEEAFHALQMASFKMVPSTRKRYLVAVDVRNPMVHSRVVGCSVLTPADATALLLMALTRAEGSNVTAVAFSAKGMVNIDINNKMAMSDITRRMRETPMGPVNMAMPLQWAQENKRAFDIIITCTDNQTNPGDIHPAEALKEYRKSLNMQQVRFIVCAMASRGFSLAPPDEPSMLDIAGFDTRVLQIIQDFARGVF